MRTALTLFVAVCLTATAPAADKEERVYEMRTYHAAPGKLEALHARFRDHTLKLFEKHGITSVGYWVPVENKDNTGVKVKDSSVDPEKWQIPATSTPYVIRPPSVAKYRAELNILPSNLRKVY